MTTTIGARIAHIRGGRSQKRFADELGVHTNTIGNYERGVRLPDAEFLTKLARSGYNVNWVLTGEGSIRLEEGADSILQAETTPYVFLSQAMLEDAISLAEGFLDEDGRRLTLSQRVRYLSKAIEIYKELCRHDTGQKREQMFRDLLGKLLDIISPR